MYSNYGKNGLIKRLVEIRFSGGRITLQKIRVTTGEKMIYSMKGEKKNVKRETYWLSFHVCHLTFHFMVDINWCVSIYRGRNRIDHCFL